MEKLRKCKVCGWKEYDVEEVEIRGVKYVACKLCREHI